MTYYISDPTDSAPRARRLWVAAALLAAALLALVAVIWAGTAGPSAASAGAAPLRWTLVGSQPVPTSEHAGPTQVRDGTAAGFSHDEQGAALAAINITARLTDEAGPGVAETVVQRQCVGDQSAELTRIRTARSAAPPASTVPAAYFYRIVTGDPRGAAVLVTVAVDTPQSRAAGGYAAVTHVLRWTDGDWRVEVPLAPARLVGSVATYQHLGVPHV